MSTSASQTADGRLLNPALYRGLVQLYRDPRQVRILRPGQPNRWQQQWRAVDGGAWRWCRHPVERGEEFSVNCFLCGDHRGRLLINHCFGVWNEDYSDQHLWMVNCFHRQCFASRERQLYLYDLLYVYGAPVGLIRDSVPVVDPRPAPLEPLTTVPADIVPLAELPRWTPLGELHPAWTYLQDRGFSPQRLTQLYGVGFCRSSSVWPKLAGRLFIPIYQDGRLYGFQGRYPGEVGKHSPHQPKYWNMPGLRKEQLVYGIDLACRFPVLLLCEGVFDVWSAGPCSVALLGKTLSTPQLEVICRRLPEGFVAVVALDPDQPAQDVLKQRPHHLVELYLALRGVLGPERVKMLWLPPGTDCGSLTTEFIWARILEQAGEDDGVWGTVLRNVAEYCCRNSCRLGAGGG